MSNVQVGSIIEGKVARVKPFGAIVLIGDNSQGLVHISHISDSFVQDIDEHIAVGDIVRVKVLSIDTANNKIALSMKEAMEKAEPQAPVQNYRERDFQKPKESNDPNSSFEDKFKEWVKISNERQAGINRRNKRR